MLTVVSAPVEGGNFTYDPPLCEAKTYGSGTVVTLTAVPNNGYRFAKWSGDIGNNSGSNTTIQVVMDKERNITADFSSLSSFHWGWVVAGIAFLLVLLLTVRFTSRRTKKPDSPMHMQDD